MSSTLKDVINAIKDVEEARPKIKRKLADELLGKYKGIIPKGKTSTEFIRKLRNSLYGKTA